MSLLGTVSVLPSLELLPLWQFELHGQTLSFLLLHLQGILKNKEY